ncbi:MAG: 6-pyruvoyl-tetrahydropterin synthase-related protein [Nanoarchaeota archaeon]|nr:6-pyruvoyl-tetrahydropterin synthase-related protein [Nanoarchaeota archaeon]
MRLSDKILILPIMILALNLIFRLINAVKIVWQFPLDYVNDLAAYISMLHFLREYGFLGFVPNWYNGFILFKAAAPGWAFFAYPFYLITNDVLLATYLSIIALFGLGFVGILLIGKVMNLSRVKTLALYFLIYANPLMIGSVLKQGRLPEFMALVVFTFLVWLALYYKDKKVGWGVIWLGVIYGILILTHQAETVLGGLFLLGLLIIKKNKERIYIVLALIFGLMISSFWLINFIKGAKELGVLDLNYGNWLLSFDQFLFGNLALIVLPLGVMFLGYLFLKESTYDNKLFFAPVLVIAFLLLFRLTLFIPILKFIYPDAYQNFFVFFGALFLVGIDYSKISKKLKYLLGLALVVCVVLGVGYNITMTPYFEDYDQLNYDFIEIMEEVDGVFIITSTEYEIWDMSKSYDKALYSYASVFLDKNSAGGWSYWFKDAEYIDYYFSVIHGYAKDRDCESYTEGLVNLNVTEVIGYKSECEYMVSECGFTEKDVVNDLCLLRI